MSTWGLYLLLGLGAGAVYAALAMGVICVYQGTGVVNFAHGAMAMYPAQVFVSLRQDGELSVPPLPTIELGAPMAFAPALAIALVVAAGLGLLAYAVIFRPLRNAPPVTKVIASIGLTIVLQGLAVLRFGVGNRRADAILPAGTTEVFGRPVPVDRFWFVLVVVVAGAGLFALYRWTSFGLATRAAASSEKGAELLGFSPNRLGAVNWVIGALLAGGAGVLMTAISGVNPFNYSLFIVPALVAALAARLRSFVVAGACGIALGMFEGLAVHLVAQQQVPVALRAGFESSVPFAVIILLLVLAGRTLPDRGTLLEGRQPAAPLPVVRPGVVVAVLALGTAVMGWGDPGLRLAAIESLIVTTLVLSVVVLTGLVGQVSLAQLSFAGLSAFLLSRFAERWGLPFPISPLAAIAVTTVVGVAVGMPALRIRGIQFTIVTLAAAVVMEQLLFRSPAITGPTGTAHVDPPTLAGIDLGIIGPGQYPYRPFGFLVLAVTAACAVLVVNVRRTSMGRRFLAVRINERAAAASGVDVARTKLLAAGVGSFVAAVAGVLLAYKNVDYSAVGFEASRGLQILALAYLGGIASVTGAVIAGLLAPAGLVFSLVTDGDSSRFQLLVSGLGLVIVAVRFPGGIASLGGPLRRALRRRTPADEVGPDDLDAVELLEPVYAEPAATARTRTRWRS